MTTIKTHGSDEPVRTIMPYDTLAAALAAFQAEVPVIPKSKRANVGKYAYTYASLADVMAVAGPLLGKHGLSFTAIPGPADDGQLMLVGRLMHVSGDTVEGILPIRGGNPQDLGSSITYMRRYLLGCLTGIVTDDDVDGQLAQRVNQVQGQALRDRLGSETAPAPVPVRLPDDVIEALEKKFGEVGELRGEEVTVENRQAAFKKWTGREVAMTAELTAEEAVTAGRLLDNWISRLKADGEVEEARK